MTHLKERKKTVRRGFFGGSFDPIHNGHLHLVLELFERHALDEVFIVPTSQSPHKKEAPPLASKEHRRAMVTHAIAPFPEFTLLDDELQKTSPCYTIDTIRSLFQKDAASGGTEKEYFLMLGDDAASTLATWKEVDQLIQMTTPIVGSREKECFLQPSAASPALASLLQKGWTLIPRLEVSSSWIRSRIQEGKYAGHLVPQKVWDYIQAHHLYEVDLHIY